MAEQSVRAETSRPKPLRSVSAIRDVQGTALTPSSLHGISSSLRLQLAMLSMSWYGAHSLRQVTPSFSSFCHWQAFLRRRCSAFHDLLLQLLLLSESVKLRLASAFNERWFYKVSCLRYLNVVTFHKISSTLFHSQLASSMRVPQALLAHVGRCHCFACSSARVCTIRCSLLHVRPEKKSFFSAIFFPFPIFLFRQKYISFILFLFFSLPSTI